MPKKTTKWHYSPKQKQLRSINPKDGRLYTLKQHLYPEELYREHLLETPVFTRNNKGDIKLYNPRVRQNVRCQDAEILLNALAYELWRFFLDRNERLKNPPFINEMVNLNVSLEVCKKLFIVAGVKERDFAEVMETIKKWNRKLIKHICKNTPKPIAKRIELMGIIFPYYKELCPGFAENDIFFSIAHIFKSLGLEEDNVDKIARRIKRNYLREKKPAQQINQALLSDLKAE